jgi:hypothetical protein
MLPFLLLAHVLQAAPGTSSPPAVPVPRIVGTAVVVDGRLEEPVWRDAAVLTEFYQYLPVDDRLAQDSTTVLVWYSPTAIYFGIRAYQDSSSVRATLADRDKISGDDYFQICLDTFNDQRQALLFAVNPLGIQADGTLQDAARRSLSFISSVPTGAYAVDLSPDFVFESKGRVTGFGYEVELRVPFKTLRYQSRDVQDWGINIIRRVQASGHEHTWTRVLQANASFLAQGGMLTGLTGLRRGLVLDVNPEMTSTVTGGPGSRDWDYSGGRPELGVNLRWGISNNLTVNGTANPDFSQVEADVAQLQYDPREALFFPEKRPFFLDGLELFQTPVSLIHTRRLVDPVSAVKLSGKLSGTTVALLSGVDHRDASATGDDHPIYNLLRVRRDIGGQSTVGLAYTDKIDGDGFNRVASVDGRLVFAGQNTLTFQGGSSATRGDGETTWAPFWLMSFNRSGQHFRLRVNARGFHGDFRAASGFVSRVGVVYAGVSPSYTFSGVPGAALESWTANILVDGRWDYDRFFAGDIPNDPRLHFNTGFTFRGGWQMGASFLIESFKYPPELYTEYATERTVGTAVDTVPFVGTDRLYNFDFGVNFATPRFQRFSANAFVIVGRDENFFEWAPANIVIGTVDLTWRPSDKLRINLLYNHQQYIRPDDWSNVGLRRVPRLKIEYQLTRAIFVRFVGQYDAEVRDALRDNSRTDDPILIRDAATGVFTRAMRTTRNDVRVDWLFSFRPNPGTVLFLGYGSTLAAPDAFRFGGLARVADGFFAKLSYLFRI